MCVCAGGYSCKTNMNVVVVRFYKSSGAALNSLGVVPIIVELFSLILTSPAREIKIDNAATLRIIN